jgi:FkbM family methyltransferase
MPETLPSSREPGGQVMRTSLGMPNIIRAAIWWNRVGIKGKGAIPRVLGRIWQGENLFISTRHGGLLSVDASNLHVYACIYNSGGQWEPHVMQVCERLLRPGDIYYDIGSNTGLFTIDAALTIPDLRVYAFEPQPSLANHIRRSIVANNLHDVRCLEVMIGREDGEKLLYMTSHSIHASIIPRERRFRALSCPMRTLDSLILSREIEVSQVIKIDVEGAETLGFEGAQQTLKINSASIIFEADENLLRMQVKSGAYLRFFCERHLIPSLELIWTEIC